MLEIAELEARFEAVRDELSPAERDKLRRSSSYGHDLSAAIARGWRRKAAKAMQEALDYVARSRGEKFEPGPYFTAGSGVGPCR